MTSKALLVDLQLDHKVESNFSLLFNADNFKITEIIEKVVKAIDEFGGDNEVQVQKLCFYANTNRLNPIHLVHNINKVNSLSLVLKILLLVNEYSKDDELRLSSALGVFEHTDIPVDQISEKNIDSIVAHTYYVSDNFKQNELGVKEDIRKKNLIYCEIGRGVCIGLYPSHPYQSQKTK